MKCVVQDSVFETSKITLMRKDTECSCPYIVIMFDSGVEKHFYFNNAVECESEWKRIMECWRSDEINVEIGPLTVGD